jgi:hypothetical protein
MARCSTSRVRSRAPTAPLNPRRQRRLERDVRVVESWRAGRGPKVRANGAVPFKPGGAYIQGSLSKSSAIGGASATDGEECRGTGRFNAQRRHTSW